MRGQKNWTPFHWVSWAGKQEALNLVPGCNPCGMSVDMLRSCYESEWHLFRDDPTRRTKGYYYFSADDTPVLQGMHYFGSRNWHDANYEKLITLGEDVEVKQSWLPGVRPGLPPITSVINAKGSCLQLGDLVADGIDGTALVAGFPPACFRAGAGEPPFGLLADVWECSVQLFYAEVIELLYAGNAGAAVAACRAFVGPTPIITFHSRSGVQTATITIVSPNYAIAITEGTTNFQQIALYSFYGISPPNNFGILSTNLAFYNNASYVHSLLVADGANPAAPVLLSGHSYGGATCLVLAARYAKAQPTRDVRYLTYGAPKSGDIRLRMLLTPLLGVGLEDDQDFVTVLPPDLSILAPVIALLGLPGLTVWLPWQRTPSTILQFPDGSFVLDTPTIISTATLLDMVQHVLAHLSIFGFPAHPIQQYLASINKRCKRPPAPAAGAAVLAGGIPHANVGLAAALPAHDGLALAALIASAGNVGLTGPVLARGGLCLNQTSSSGGGIALLVTPSSNDGLGLNRVPEPADGLGLNRVPEPADGLGLNVRP